MVAECCETHGPEPHLNNTAINSETVYAVNTVINSYSGVDGNGLNAGNTSNAAFTGNASTADAPATLSNPPNAKGRPS